MLTQLAGDGDAERRDGADGRDRAAFTRGAEAALRRAHPVRVALLFALASIAVLAVVFVLRQRLGLPDWVLPGAAVLLAIGLPIMLVTGRKERERVLAAATGTYLPSRCGSREAPDLAQGDPRRRARVRRARRRS